MWYDSSRLSDFCDTLLCGLKYRLAVCYSMNDECFIIILQSSLAYSFFHLNTKTTL